MSALNRILDPTAPSENQPQPVARVGNLAGKVVGFIDNAKPNFDLLAQDITAILKTRYGAAEVITRRKRGASMAAPESVIAEVSERCDLVICGMGDCGGCTTWSIHDSIGVARRGKPVIAICSTAFRVLGQHQATGLGYPSLPIILVEHPFGLRTREEVQMLAQTCAQEIAQVSLAQTA